MRYPDTRQGPTQIEWEGRRYYLSQRRTVAYYYPAQKLPGERTKLGLHQAIYEKVHGPIPSGHVVHHRDGNSLNNDPTNLEAKPKGLHQAEHMAEKYADPKHRAAVAAQLAATAVPLAAAWHASEEGRAWHRANAEAMWSEEGRAHLRHERTCVECGDTFTAHMRDARFCSTRCFQRMAAKDGRYRISATCEICGAEFDTSRFRPGATCSVECRWERVHRRRKAQREAS